MPKVSVVVPVYNAEKYIGLCLNSLIHQKLKDIEIICVDDCSADTSLNVLEEYSKKDKRIKVIKFDKNKGVSAARNIGIKKAKSDYIVFVDSDDYIDLDFIYCLYNKIIQTNANIVCADQRVFSDTDRTIIKNQYMGKNKYDFNIGFYSRIYKKDFLISNNIYFPVNCIIGEDILFLLKCLFYLEDIEHISGVYYNYILHNSSASFKILKYTEVKNTVKSLLMFIDWLNKTNCKYKDYKELSRKVFGLMEVLSKKDLDEESKYEISDAFLKLYDKLLYKHCLKRRKHVKMLYAMKQYDKHGVYHMLFNS